MKYESSVLHYIKQQTSSYFFMPYSERAFCGEIYHEMSPMPSLRLKNDSRTQVLFAKPMSYWCIPYLYEQLLVYPQNLLALRKIFFFHLLFGTSAYRFQLVMANSLVDLTFTTMNYGLWVHKIHLRILHFSFVTQKLYYQR
jgi:hypothetical protein